jgi:hypothetical protein
MSNQKSLPLTLILSPWRGEATQDARYDLTLSGPTDRLSSWEEERGGEELTEF